MAVFLLSMAHFSPWIFFIGRYFGRGVRGELGPGKGGGSLSRLSELPKLKIHFKGSPRPFFYCAGVVNRVKIWRASMCVYEQIKQAPFWAPFLPFFPRF
jgi:hypothetical protein